MDYIKPVVATTAVGVSPIACTSNFSCNKFTCKTYSCKDNFSCKKW